MTTNYEKIKSNPQSIADAICDFIPCENCNFKTHCDNLISCGNSGGYYLYWLQQEAK